MDHIILEFLEAYKSLDELCKQILSTDRGISDYIDEMKYESQGYRMVASWEKDLKQLKRLRWIRNKLVHEVDSFQENLIHKEDIEWLITFRSQIMECKDPLSVLSQLRSPKREMRKQTNILVGVIILIGVFLFAIMFFIGYYAII